MSALRVLEFGHFFDLQEWYNALSITITLSTEMFGHIILRLLPYHPDLNPIELVWAQLKKIVSSRNFNNKLDDVLEITKAAFTEISVQNWENMGKHVINVEEEYTRKDIVIDQEMDKYYKLFPDKWLKRSTKCFYFSVN
jgi:hypothetical protein